MCDKKRKVSLIGIGTGGVKEMTERAKEEILASDCLIGASRMLESAACFLEQKKDIKRRDMLSEYRWDFIFSYVKEHEECSRTAVLFSGDIGFYSGAKKLEAALLHSEIDCTVELIPGISSVVYFAAKLGVSWDDAKIVSLHGNETLFIQTVDTNRKTFFLLGGKDAGERLLNALLEYGMGELFLSVGRDLSYEDEKIIRKKAADFQIEEVRGLCTALVENENPAKRRGPHIRDDAFVRGKVPMTKEEVRAVSIARMELTEDAYVAFAARNPEFYTESLELEKSMEQFGREWEQQPEFRQLKLRREWRANDRQKYDAENERLITALKNSYRTSVSI